MAKCEGGFAAGWVRHLKISSKWAHRMCFDPQKILDQYLWRFGKYHNMHFAKKCAFLTFFTFFWVFWPILANFEAIFNIFTAHDSFFLINLEASFYLTMICTKKWDLKFSTTLVNKCWLNHYVVYWPLMLIKDRGEAPPHTCIPFFAVQKIVKKSIFPKSSKFFNNIMRVWEAV